MAEAPTQIRYNLTREEYTPALRYATQRLVARASRGWLPVAMMVVGAICGAVIALAYFQLAEGYRGSSAPWAASGVVAFLVVWIAAIWHQQYRVTKIYSVSVADDGIVLGPQEFTVTPEALVHRHRGAMTHLAWPALKLVEERDGNVLIFIDNAAFYAVPEKAFADAGERAAWMDLLCRRSRPEVAAMAETPRAESASLQSPVRVAGTRLGLLRNFRAGIKLAALQRVDPRELTATAEGFIAVVILGIVVSVLLGVATVGMSGQLNFYELPRALMGVTLILAVGLIVTRASGDSRALLVLAVSLSAAGVVIGIVMGAVGLLAHHKIFEVPWQQWKYIHYATYAWWSAVVAVVVWRLTPPASRRRLATVAAGLVLLVLPSWFIPATSLWVPKFDPESDPYRSGFWAITEEKAFYAQHDALPRALAAIQPERPGIADLYVITAGLYSSEDVFMKEVRVIDSLFRERFDADGRTLMLINNPKTLEEHPVASLSSLTAALRHVGKLMNAEEDVLVLYVSSHGNQAHKLSVEFGPLRFHSIDPPALKDAVQKSGIKWKVIVVSACYSGGFVEPLKDDHTLIITASAPTKISFGCGNDSDSTYLAKALFDEEMRKTYSFETAFAQARKSIEERERGQGFVPSEPQIFVGAAVRDKLAEIERRLAARAPESVK